jgi:hypothetical protein
MQERAAAILETLLIGDSIKKKQIGIILRKVGENIKFYLQRSVFQNSRKFLELNQTKVRTDVAVSIHAKEIAKVYYHFAFVNACALF